MFTRQKNWLTNLDGGKSKSKSVHSLENLKYLYGILLKNQTVTEQNCSLLVETLRFISEILIWGDQNDSTVFDFFLEKNMLVFFLKFIKQKSGQTMCVQLLQTLNILFENISDETSVYYLLSNNHVNSIIIHKFDFSDEEVMAYYISFLKTLSIKLNRHTVHFFYNEHTNDFALYTEAIKFFKHSEGMVRIAVRTITLNVYRASLLLSKPEDDQVTATDTRDILGYLGEKTGSSYFVHLVSFIASQIADLHKCIREDTDHHNREKIEYLIAEHLDHLHYLNDILTLHIHILNNALVTHLFEQLFDPLYIRPLLTPCKKTGFGEEQVVSIFLLSQVYLTLHYDPIINRLTQILFGATNASSQAGTEDAGVPRFDLPFKETNSTDEEKLLLSQRGGSACCCPVFANRAYLSVLLSSLDCSTGDHLTLVALCFFYALELSQGIQHVHALTTSDHQSAQMSAPASSSGGTGPSYDDYLLDSLLNILSQACQHDSKVRLATLELAILLLKKVMERRKGGEMNEKEEVDDRRDGGAVTEDGGAVLGGKSGTIGGVDAESVGVAKVGGADDDSASEGGGKAGGFDGGGGHEGSPCDHYQGHHKDHNQYHHANDDDNSTNNSDKNTVNTENEDNFNNNTNNNNNITNNNNNITNKDKNNTNKDDTDTTGVTNTPQEDKHHDVERVSVNADNVVCNRKNDDDDVSDGGVDDGVKDEGGVDDDGRGGSVGSITTGQDGKEVGGEVGKEEESGVVSGGVEEKMSGGGVSGGGMGGLREGVQKVEVCVEGTMTEATLLLRYYFNVWQKSEEIFLDMFEDEYRDLTNSPLRVEHLTMEACVILPPISTPLTGIHFCKRLPCGEVERARKAIRAFFLMRTLSFHLRHLVDSCLPLTKPHECVQPGDVLDLNNSDLIACTVMQPNKKEKRFLVIDIMQLILVEPDCKKLGWGLVKFVAFLQDTEVAGDKDDSRCLQVTIHKGSSRCFKNTPSYSSKFLFDDHIRCMAARQRLTKGRLKARQRKMHMISKLLSLPSHPSITLSSEAASSSSSPSSSTSPFDLFTPSFPGRVHRKRHDVDDTLRSSYKESRGTSGRDQLPGFMLLAKGGEVERRSRKLKARLNTTPRPSLRTDLPQEEEVPRSSEKKKRMFLTMASEVRKQRSQRATSEEMEMGSRKPDPVVHLSKRIDTMSLIAVSSNTTTSTATATNTVITTTALTTTTTATTTTTKQPASAILHRDSKHERTQRKL